MFSYSKISKLVVLVLMVFSMSSCNDSVDQGVELLTCSLPQIPDAAGKQCIDPPPIACLAPAVPNAANNACIVGFDPTLPPPADAVKVAEANKAILFYNRKNKGASNDPDTDTSYDRWKLHTWNNGSCDAYEQSSIAEGWENGVPHTGIDSNYGAYWILNLKEGYGDCANFIIHDINEKEMGGFDFKMNLVQDDPDFVRMNWTLSGVADVFEYPILKLGVSIKDFAAHWIDANTLIWDINTNIVSEVRLHHSATSELELDPDTGVNGAAVILTATTLTAEQEALVPKQTGWAAFSGNWTADEAKAMVKNQLVLASYDADGVPVNATHIQAAKVLDALYTSGVDDADEAALGVVYSASDITVSLWAPTAQAVNLQIFAADKTLSSTEQMVEDPTTGIWSFTGSSSLDLQFYRYELTVYHHATDAIETIWSTDPYSVSLSTNGMYSQFANLSDASLKPVGWDEQTAATITDPEDAVIYEGHIRDFSARDESTTVSNRGKYLAFTEAASAPMQHLQSLVDNGLTHFQMLPANDIASINEDPARIVDLSDTVADLCAVNADAAVCGVESDSATLLSVMESYTTFSEDAQALAQAMRGYDSFNWGYDPKHFNVPEGIYASNADGAVRILEIRSMIQSLHEMGLRVSLDVVYNHTNSAGLFDNSVFDKVVPGYYHRRDLISGNVQQSTCCNDTSLENRMMDKFMNDSLKIWAEEYRIDGFRFDIMSHGSKAQMLAVREAIRVIDPDSYFYGEGWYRGDLGFENATQDNMAGTEIGTFNDRLRDSVRGTALFSGDGSDDNMNQQDIMRLGLAGTLSSYILKDYNGNATAGSSFSPAAYASDPADVINYVSKHDDNSLWDQLQFGLPIGMNPSERVRVQNISATIPLMSQGIPFLQIGGDLMRSKSMDKNSFDAGDWFNFVDFTKMTNNWNVGLPLAQDNSFRWNEIIGISSNPNTQAGSSDVNFAGEVFKEYLGIRNASKLFRLTSGDDVIARVGFHNIGNNQTQGLVVMSIDDGIDLVDIDPANDAIVVVINGSALEQSKTVATASGFELHSAQAASIDTTVQGSIFSEGTGEGTFTVPAYTTAVFVKPQGTAQGTGLSAFATSGAPDVVPYGSTTVFVRGEMNGWSEDDPMVYKGNGIYRVAVPLTGGTSYGFKVASADWSTVDLGATSGEEVVTEGAEKILVTSGANLSFTPGIDATYVFEINAFDVSAPVLKVFNENPYPGTTVFIRGGMNGWGEADPMTFIGGGIYNAELTIIAGIHEFKVASADWLTVDFGHGEADATVTEGVAKFLGGNGNLSMDFLIDNTYTFIFDASGLAPKTVTVWTTQMFGATPVYLRGAMNGWGTNDEMLYDGASVYSVEIAVTAGTHEFKVASSDWLTVNLGANEVSNTVTLGSGYVLVAGSNGNLSLTVATDGVYKFEVTGPNPNAPTVIVTDVTP